MSHDVFISHSSRDKAVADAICNALENAGLRCWIAPRDLIAGRPFSGEIMRGIKACRVMVLLFSSHANASPEVLREVQLATTNRLHLVNFRIENSRVSDDLAYFLGIPHWLDAINEPMKENHEKLVESVRALLALPPKDAPSPSGISKPAAPSAGPGASTPTWSPPASAQKNASKWMLLGAAALILAGLAFYFTRDHGNSSGKSAASNTPTNGKSQPDAPAGDITERFAALANSSGLIADPKTPEQHYRNARLHEVAGNTSAARQEYSAYLAADLDMLDPWLNYSSMLKIQEGREGAVENVRTLGGKSKSVSCQIALALLDDREPRLARLTALEKEHPDFGPLLYLLSQEYSEQKRGTPTLAEIRAEREWLERFRAAHTAGKFVKYFLDKKEAEQWLSTAEARWSKVNSTPAEILKEPVKLSLLHGSDGWMANFLVSDFSARELLYQLDGKGDFVSTGHLAATNPATGQPVIKPSVLLPILGPGEHTLAVKYVDTNNQTNGPYLFKFDLAGATIKQAQQQLQMGSGSWLYYTEDDGKTNLWFVRILIQRPALKEIRYSLDSETLDQTFAFPPGDKFLDPGPKMNVTIPPTTQYVAVQITYKDDTKSALERYPVKK